MTMQVKELLGTFDYLSESEQKEFAFEILQRTLHFDFPPFQDDDLVMFAEELFLDLDREEAING